MKSYFESAMNDQMDHAMMIDEDLGLVVMTAYIESDAQYDPAGLLRYCLIPRTRREIDDFLRVMHPKIKRVEAVRALLALNLLRMTRPDAPNSPDQEYYTVRNTRK